MVGLTIIQRTVYTGSRSWQPLNQYRGWVLKMRNIVPRAGIKPTLQISVLTITPPKLTDVITLSTSTSTSTSLSDRSLWTTTLAIWVLFDSACSRSMYITPNTELAMVAPPSVLPIHYSPGAVAGAARICLFACCFASYQHLRSYQNRCRLVTERTHGDFIVLPHWQNTMTASSVI